MKGILAAFFCAALAAGAAFGAEPISQNYIDDLLNEALDRLEENSGGYGPDGEFIVELSNGEIIELIRGGSAAIYDKNAVRIYTILSDGREIAGAQGEKALPRSRAMKEMYPMRNAAGSEGMSAKVTITKDSAPAAAPAPAPAPVLAAPNGALESQPTQIRELEENYDPHATAEDVLMGQNPQGYNNGAGSGVMAPYAAPYAAPYEPEPAPTPAPTPAPAPAPAPAQNHQFKLNAQGAPIGYYIQVAAYSNPANPNRAELNAIGQFDYIIENTLDAAGRPLRRYLIGPYPTKESMAHDMPYIKKIINYLHHGQTSEPYIRYIK